MAWGSLHRDLPLESVEADFGEGPVTVYFKPMNIRQRKLIAAAGEKSEQDAVTMCLMLRARTSDGIRMFKDSDRDKIETQFDPEEVDRVVIEMSRRNGPEGN